MEPIEKITYKGHTINVHFDDNPTDPREWDNLGVMVCWHRGYKLGDKHDWKEPQDFLDSEEAKEGEVLPLYLYDHSGITMRTSPFSCKWDSGQVGYIYASKDAIVSEYGDATTKSREKVRGVLESEVASYDLFLTGQILGYVIKGELCNESCWGFEDKNYMIKEAKNAIDYAVKEQEEYIAFQAQLT